MKAIIIQDEDVRALLDRLELTAMRNDGFLTVDDAQITVQNMHRTFHYIVVDWAQKHGASVTR